MRPDRWSYLSWPVPASGSRAGNRLFLVFWRKPPPRLLCHPVPPGRYLIYRLVRDPGATSALPNSRAPRLPAWAHGPYPRVGPAHGLPGQATDKRGYIFAPLLTPHLSHLAQAFGIVPGTICFEVIATAGGVAKDCKRVVSVRCGRTIQSKIHHLYPSQRHNAYQATVTAILYPSQTPNPVTDTKSRKPAAANGCDVVTDARSTTWLEATVLEQSERETKSRRRVMSHRSDE